jgi:hypothetical protein
MSKLTFAGLASLCIGGVLIVFQVVGGLISTGGDLAWKNLTLLDIIGKSHFDWIAGMPDGILHTSAQYIVNMQLYLLLICVGILFLILGRLTSKL